MTTHPVSALCTWLVAYVESVRFDEAAAEMVDEIEDVYRRLTRAVDNSADRIYVGPCGAEYLTATQDDDGEPVEGWTVCERDLYRDTASSAARCDGYRQDGRGCGTKHDLAQRQYAFRASIEDFLAPIVEWQSALPAMFPNRFLWPTRWTWARWADDPPHLLERHGEDHVGRGMFRGADVLAQVESEQPRMKRKRDADERAREMRAS